MDLQIANTPPRSFHRAETGRLGLVVLSLALVSGCPDGDPGASASTTLGPPPPTTTATTTATTTTNADTEPGVDDTTMGDPTAGPADTTETSSSTGPGGGSPGFCQETCATDRDCLIDGVDEGYVCSEGRCIPSGQPDMCNDDLFCQIVLAAAVGGALFCEAPADCPGDELCVALDGFTQGACVSPVDAMGQCPNLHEPVTLPTIDGPREDVCIALDVVCDPVAGPAPLFYCNGSNPCRADADCDFDPTRPVCGGDGACVCTEDAHCALAAGLPSCVEGRCACTSDDDCAGMVGFDACVDGYCGCSSDASCQGESVFDGTMQVCTPP